MSVIPARGKLRFPASLPSLPRPKAKPLVDTPMTLVEHLIELRDRLIKSAIGVVITTVLAFLFMDRIMGALINLTGDHRVQALDPTETFGTYFKVAFSVGIGLAMPILVYQLLRFLAPGLKQNERRILYISLPFVAIFFLAGAAFCYFVVLPSTLNFLLNFGDPRILKQVSLTKYVSFVTSFMLAVGASFEMPLVVFLLAKLGIVSYRRLARWRKYALLLSFVISAIITPTPDPINQAIVALPIFLLYELGVQLSRFARRPHQSQAAS